MTQCYWSQDRVEQLRRLWQEGLSASQVAGVLGGVTRNAVIGKVHRLGLAGRRVESRSPGIRIPRAARLARSRAVAVIIPVKIDPLLLPDGTFATMRTIETRMCHWPIGNPMAADFHFCGRASKEKSPYCEVHNVQAHQPHKKTATQRHVKHA